MAALKWLPYGGLYVSGGIAAKNPGWVLLDLLLSLTLTLTLTPNVLGGSAGLGGVVRRPKCVHGPEANPHPHPHLSLTLTLTLTLTSPSP